MVRYRRDDIVDRAIEVLDRYGLADLTMRRLGSELGVAASAIYHHFPDKQSLLAAVANELLERGRREPDTSGSWRAVVRGCCTDLHATMLSCTDGAEVIATAYAYQLGVSRPYEELITALDGVISPRLASVAAQTLLHFTFGHAGEVQVSRQASSAGAIGRTRRGSADFTLGLELIMDGIAASAS